MEIRMAIPEDVPEILQFLRKSWQLCSQHAPQVFRSGVSKYGPSQVLGMLNRADTPVFVAVEKEKVLGCCLCQIHTYCRDILICDHRDCCIDTIYVEESVRRQGVGTKLFEAVRCYAKEQNCRCVSVQAWQAQESALAFFTALGLHVQTVGMQAHLEES